jgi:hypothetical protein
MCGGSAGTSCSTAGTSNSLSPGTTGLGAAGNFFCIGEQNSSTTCGGNALSGQIIEDSAWVGTVFTGIQQTNMNANQYSFWGPF